MEKVRPGDSILDKVNELVALANRKVEGPYVVPAPQGWFVGGPLSPPPSEPLIPFELYDDRDPSSTASSLAWPLKDDYSRDDTVDPPTLMVNDDVLGDVRAYGSNHGWSTPTRGAMGFYILGTDGLNQIVAIQRLSKLCEAKVTAIVLPDTSVVFSVNYVHPLDDGQSPVAQDIDVITGIKSLDDWGCPANTPIQIVPDGLGGWRLATAERMAMLYLATTTSAVTGGTFTVNNLTPRERGLNPFQSSDEITVYNSAGWTTVATSGVNCIISIITLNTADFIQGPCGA